jgi:hypothetical protein
MKAVAIHDSDGTSLAFDLIDLLKVLAEAATECTWECRDVEASGLGATRIHAASDAGDRLTGRELLQALGEVHQVVDGDFFARRPGDEQPWLVIRAMDSSMFVVTTEDDAALGCIRESFRDVRESPPDADFLA